MFKHNFGSQTMAQVVMQKSYFSVWTNHFYTIIQTIKRCDCEWCRWGRCYK